MNRDPGRRRWLGRAAALSAALLSAGASRAIGPVRPASPVGAAGPGGGAGPAPGPPADAAGHRCVGEFEPMSTVWLSYDAGHESLTAGLVAALRDHVALRFVVPDGRAETAVRELLVARGQGPRPGEAPLEFLHEPLASFFVRDPVVFTRGPRGEPGVIDFRWSQYGVAAWCRRRHADPRVAADCAANADYTREDFDAAFARRLGARLHPSRLALEGGGFETNGRGLVLANAELLDNRNPGVDRATLERWLLALPGLRKVIWLPGGLAEDPLLRATITGDFVAWGAGGHTDEFVRFADARTVLLAWPDDADVAAHPVSRLTRQRMARCLAVLQRERDADGRPLVVLKVPMPRPVQRYVYLAETADTAHPRARSWAVEHFPPRERRRAGQRLTEMAMASYLNFVVANGVVVLPDYRPHGTSAERQRRVQRVFERAFPGRQIRYVDAITANWVGGGLHCATLNQA
jgi:agmatine deiminase